MTIPGEMEKKNFSKYKLSQISGIPYTTVSDICGGKARLEKCSAETVYKLAKALDVSMETLLAPCMEERNSFALFKSNVCHRVKALGDEEFIMGVLERDDIRMYYQKKWYPECLYLLAMLDYLSRVNGIPLCDRYTDLRRCRLREPVYPSGVLAASAVAGSEAAKEQALRDAIPEFLRFNIVEGEVRNVV